MSALNTGTGKAGAEPARGLVADPTDIVFHEGAGIEGRRAGVVYTVDGALAQHYVTAGKARLVESAPAPAASNDEPDPGEPSDRSMSPPPRGRRRG